MRNPLQPESPNEGLNHEISRRALLLGSMATVASGVASSANNLLVGQERTPARPQPLQSNDIEDLRNRPFVTIMQLGELDEETQRRKLTRARGRFVAQTDSDTEPPYQGLVNIAVATDTGIVHGWAFRKEVGTCEKQCCETVTSHIPVVIPHQVTTHVPPPLIVSTNVNINVVIQESQIIERQAWMPAHCTCGDDVYRIPRYYQYGSGRAARYWYPCPRTNQVRWLHGR